MPIFFVVFFRLSAFGSIFSRICEIRTKFVHISASAIFGNGGNIKIIANGYLPSLESVVIASSEYGVQGNIEINTPESNLTLSLVTLPDKIKDDSVKLIDRYTLNLSGEISSFFIKGQVGLPIWSRENFLPNSTR